MSLSERLTPLKRRLQWRLSLRVGWFSLFLGLLISALLLLLGRWQPLLFNWQLALIGATLILVLVVLGQAYVWLKDWPLSEIARAGDVWLKLDDRLTTALELENGLIETTPALKQAQWQDTLAQLEKTTPKTAIPLTSRRWLTLGVVSVAALLTLALTVALAPNPQHLVLQAQEDLQELLENEVAQLEEIQTELLPDGETAPPPELAELEASLEELIGRLEAAQESGSPEEAMAALSEASAQLEQLEQAQDQAAQSEQEALQALTESLAQSDNQTAQSTAESLQEGDTAQAAESLQSMAETPNSSEANALSEALSQAAQNASPNSELGQAMQSAAEALNSGDAQAAEQALSELGEQLAQSGQAGQNAQQELAEALENIQQAREQLAQQSGQAGQSSSMQQGGQSGQAGQNGQMGQNGQNGQGGQSGQGGESGESGETDGPQMGSGTGSGQGGSDSLESNQGTQGEMESFNSGQNSAQGEGAVEDYNAIFDPQFLGGEGGPLAVPPGQNPDSGDLPIGQTAPNANRPTGEVTTSLEEIQGQYRNEALEDIETRPIPLPMQDMLRQYFAEP